MKRTVFLACAIACSVVFLGTAFEAPRTGAPKFAGVFSVAFLANCAENKWQFVRNGLTTHKESSQVLREQRLAPSISYFGLDKDSISPYPSNPFRRTGQAQGNSRDCSRAGRRPNRGSVRAYTLHLAASLERKPSEG